MSNRANRWLRRAATGLVLASMLAVPVAAEAAATIVIINGDPAGVGFNDPTPVAPVGGNPGVTLGQQRLNVYTAVANKWGATLTSAAQIKVYATWEALSCTASSAVLGSAGAWDVFRDFPNAPVADTWHSVALANKRAGIDLTPGDPGASDVRDVLGVDIVARFNVNLGSTGCLTGSPFYLGLDNNHGPLIDFYTVLLHELGHGLGFQSFFGSTGARLNDGTPHPHMWERFMRDNKSGKLWLDMTNAERAASTLNFRGVVWTGANVAAASSSVLTAGSPFLSVVSTPVPSASGSYPLGTASFGPALGAIATVSAQLMPVQAQANDGGGNGCAPFSANNTLAARNNIVIIDRGVCTFVTKVKNAQNAGAKGVIIANNAAGTPPGLGGADPTITIPAISVSQSDGNTLKNALNFRSRTASGVIATFGVDPALLAGADSSNRVMLFTPNPYQSGSSISHWDQSATRNLLMEPAINADLTHEVSAPDDLTFELFKDLGW